MMFEGNSLTTAPILILFMRIFGGYPLRCQPSEYIAVTLLERCCLLCPAGSRVLFDCRGSRNTICMSCTEGTYTDHPNGNLMCSVCTSCDAGSGLTTKTPCTTSSDTVCEPLEGYHCVDSTDRGCTAAEKHSSCLPGQFISQKGTALSDTVCSNCTEGTFSNGTLTSCQPHTKCESMSLRLIKPGTVSADADECGENLKWTIGIVVGILIVLVTGALVFYCCCKKRKHPANNQRETGTDEELRTISNGTPNGTTTPVHTGDDHNHNNNEHKETNGLVNGTAPPLPNNKL